MRSSLLAAAGLSLILTGAPARAAKAPGAVDTALDQLRDARWQAGLDASVYPESPYRTPEDLPPSFEVERPYQAFNDWYYFAIVDGKVW